MKKLTFNDLTDEQKNFIRIAKKKQNILVDACIGSGKTTSIQLLCEELQNKQILYLTYNRFLKEDAKKKIKSKNVKVQNYDGFAYGILMSKGVKVDGKSDIMSKFIQMVTYEDIPQYDVLIVDEYQDIDDIRSKELNLIKKSNPNIQIIFVGDMAQKIYDRTSFDVYGFINTFLVNYESINFTKCFRLNNELASRLGNIWGKKIVGVNTNNTSCIMSKEEAVNFLSTKEPKDILCLGGKLSNSRQFIQNTLESKYFNKFNKKTLYSDIAEEGDTPVTPNSAAIFTTYDRSKGLERSICVVCDFTKAYWDKRKDVGAKYSILRNLFLVAASRGKDFIIFVQDNDDLITDNELLSMYDIDYLSDTYAVESMFNFKYAEDVEKCINYINVEHKKLHNTKSIDIDVFDGLIDLSPCINLYMLCSYFNNYNIDDTISYWESCSNKKFKYAKSKSLFGKILKLTALQTGQDRYCTQTEKFITNEQKRLLHNRIKYFCQKSETVQSTYDELLNYNSKDIKIKCKIDVEKDDCIYEIVFGNSFTPEQRLQVAVKCLLSNKELGILWNIKTNDLEKITVSDKVNFKNAVIKCITRGLVCQWDSINKINIKDESIDTSSNKYISNNFIQLSVDKYPDILLNDNFIAFDTETTGLYDDAKIIELSAVYFERGKAIDAFSSCVNISGKVPDRITEITGITTEDIKSVKKREKTTYKEFLEFLSKSKYILAYNANFDIKMLRNNLERLNIDAGKLYFYDVLKLARKKIKNTKNHKLETISKRFKFTDKQLHRAEDDALLCGKVFLKLSTKDFKE